MAALFAGVFETPSFASTDMRYTLRIHNTHTDEHLTVTYRDDDRYFPDAMKKIDRFLRCHYNDKVHPMDPELIDLLNRVDNLHGGGNSMEVVSGYRSPEYNAVLASRSSGVAGKSLHMQGMAIDFRIPGVGMRRLYDSVRSVEGGGAGIYPDFVHMDVGRVRYWGTGAA